MEEEGKHVELRQLTSEDVAFLSDLQEQLNTQPHLCQADPRFWVIMDYGYRPAGDADDIDRVCIDAFGAFDYYTPDEVCRMAYDDALELGGKDYAAEWLDEYDLERIEKPDGAYAVRPQAFLGYRSLFEVISEVCEYYTSARLWSFQLETKESCIAPNTMFLTLADAQAHLAANYYHYDKDAHTYAMTAWRSPQVEQLYKILHEVNFKRLFVPDKECEFVPEAFDTVWDEKDQRLRIGKPSDDCGCFTCNECGFELMFEWGGEYTWFEPEYPYKPVGLKHCPGCGARVLFPPSWLGMKEVDK